MTTWNSTPVIDTANILVDPAGEFVGTNIKADFLAYNAPAASTWLAQVDACCRSGHAGAGLLGRRHLAGRHAAHRGVDTAAANSSSSRTRAETAGCVV